MGAHPIPSPHQAYLTGQRNLLPALPRTQQSTSQARLRSANRKIPPGCVTSHSLATKRQIQQGTRKNASNIPRPSPLSFLASAGNTNRPIRERAEVTSLSATGDKEV
ncbi:Hypothetical predicted protein [Pelobates cultripes]|uniref:Uncharacterized protein n=1 Tax=Pelobates cultripes TaxID=61616 RepID=A0AAD1SC20_PELCU|nr:Hypothetical predicted protein [Pelobates cultripes]